jgi:galactose mutarotase-like enzyme
MTDDLITIGSGALRVQVNPMGAELWSMTDAAAREYMTDADPAFWDRRAPLLFPVVGELAGGQLRVAGTAYPLPRHGFARTCRFDPVERSADHVRFRLTDTAETRAAYPFAFALDMGFRVTGLRLDMVASVHNPGTGMLPFSFGYHPAFAWPLPGNSDKPGHCLTFDHDEPQPVRRVDRATGVLLPDTEPTPVRGRDLLLDRALFEADAVIWTELNSRALRYHAPGGAALDLAFPDTPMLGLWQIPGAHYICIEPWQGHADPQGFSGDFMAKPGLVMLAPGAVRSFRLSVTVTPP